MNHWKNLVISADTTIYKAMEVINAGSLQIAMVVDESGKLCGTVTDGDVRRGLLRGISLEMPVDQIMFCEPTVAASHESRENIMATMKLKQLRQIPIVDHLGCVIGLEIWDELINFQELNNIVVLMAGGLGTRLGELTKNCPKPLLPLGNKPLLETILENCLGYGFKRFYISLNYRADMLKEYFQDGSRWGADIRYLEEDQRLGTAGALGLLPEEPEKPLLVMNADVITKVNYQQLLDFHLEQNVAATMCVKEYDFQVPYGVVKIDNCRLQEINEKPVQYFFVSAGINVINPDILKFIPRNAYLDMPVLFNNLLKQHIETAVFPIREYWLDIGKIDDYERAKDEYARIFL